MENRYTYITHDPAILNGKAVIKGTRISVEYIMELVVSGATIDEIARQYPHVQSEAVKEALMYAADAVKNEIHITASISP